MIPITTETQEFVNKLVQNGFNFNASESANIPINVTVTVDGAFCKLTQEISLDLVKSDAYNRLHGTNKLFGKVYCYVDEGKYGWLEGVIGFVTDEHNVLTSLKNANGMGLEYKYTKDPMNVVR